MIEVAAAEKEKWKEEKGEEEENEIVFSSKSQNQNFGAKIIKNTASSLIFYFPKTSTTSLDSSYSSPSDSTTTITFESTVSIISIRPLDLFF